MSAESPFRIDRLSIRNYKGIDQLDLEFPQSPMADAPDVVAIGSRNGAGKSSVIECCALLLIIPRLLAINEDTLSIANADDIVRAGESLVEISGCVRSNRTKTDICLMTGRDDVVSAERGYEYFDAPPRTKNDPIRYLRGTAHEVRFDG